MSSDSKSLRVFLVENHEDTLFLLTMLLAQMGHTVVASATTMRDALRLAQHCEFDVLISDIGLPDGDGWELLRRMRCRPQFAVAMSGLGTREDRARSFSAGYRYHLVKPTGPEQLAGILQQAVRELRSGVPERAH